MAGHVGQLRGSRQARGALYRTLRTINPIVSHNGTNGDFTRNVERWKDGQVTAGELSDAKGRFGKLRGHREMKFL